MRSFPRSTRQASLVLALLAALPSGLAVGSLVGCKKTSPSGATGSGGGANGAGAASASVAPALPPPARFTGSALARDPQEKALYLADEDAGVLRKVSLPLTSGALGTETKLAGPPAQVIVRSQEIFVTVRDPSALVVLVDESDLPDGKVREVGTIALPGDAWGMALSPDESTLVVTSAWTHRVSVVDVKTRTVVATLDVAREPRGVVFAPDGKRAFVTHLQGTTLTKIELTGAGSKASRVELPTGVTRAPRGAKLAASLGYAAAVSADGSRLFVPRHALGALAFEGSTGGWSSQQTWWGGSSVDVLMLSDETPLTPPRAKVAMVGRFGAVEGLPKEPTPPEAGALPTLAAVSFVQPRDVVYRATQRTLIVASEGTDELTEHDGDSVDPSLAPREIRLGRKYLTNKDKEPTAESGSAPTGLSLSRAEDIVYVWSRGSREIQNVLLPLETGVFDPKGEKPVLVGPFPEPLGKEAAAGRRAFFFANDSVTSGGLGCAGCHPDGRDDGFVWRQGKHAKPNGSLPNEDVFFAHPQQLVDPENDGRARQTPMLAGRVSAEGPYGWHGQSKNLQERLVEGFGLHRWSSNRGITAYERAFRLKQLEAYLRTGLRPPPRSAAPLTPTEEKGKALFEDAKTACASCHPPASDFTTRASVPLKSPLPTRAGFVADEDQSFKVPSLAFVGGTAPYYHDGSTSSLTELIEKNGNRMGNTAHLSAEERAALVAYLERL